MAYFYEFGKGKEEKVRVYVPMLKNKAPRGQADNTIVFLGSENPYAAPLRPGGGEEGE